MKIAGRGEKPFAQKIVVELDTTEGALPLSITPLPLDFHERLEKKIPSPSPPKKGYMRDKRGRFIKDSITGRPIMEFSEEDVEYKAKLALCQKRQSIAMVMEGLKEEENIEFGTKEADCKDYSEYIDKIGQELKEAGLAIGQLIQLQEAVNRASGIKKEEVDEAKSFL